MNSKLTTKSFVVYEFENEASEKDKPGASSLVWSGVGATTLRTATLVRVHSTAEYCIPAWCSSAHTRLTDPIINDALRTVTGCLRPTPAHPRRHPTWWASSERSHTACLSHAMQRCLDICSTQLSSVHRVGMHGILNRDTHLHPTHNSSVHRTTTKVRHSGQMTDGMQSGWRTLRDSELSSLTSVPARGVTRGERGHNSPGVESLCRRRITAGGAEWLRRKSQKCHKYFFNTVNLIPKEVRFEFGSAKLASWPGRHLTLLRPWCSLSWNGPVKNSVGPA